MLDDVIALLRSDLPDFKGRVEGALQLANLLRQNALPQVTPAAFVVPVGVDGGRVDAITGLYVQTYTEALAVVVVLRGAEPTGGRLRDQLNALSWSVIELLAGREVGENRGQLVLRRAFLASMTDGAIVYQIEFSLQDQMRLSR